MYKLIIVDDDLFTLEQFVSVFEWNSMGFSVVAAFPSSADCLNYLEENHVDAILTDIFMPNISGLELAETCSKLYPDIGIIITSAYTDFEYARKAIQYNIFDYILKPINDDDLEKAMARLKNYLDKKRVNSATEESSELISGEECNSTIQAIYQYVNEHYGKNFNTTDVASYVMLNPQYFSLFFKKHTGENFTQYVRRIRLEKACEMLKNTDLKISAIAERVSYKTTTHFYRHFFEKYHMTPLEYRRNK